MSVSSEEFLEALRDGVKRWGGARWIADRADGAYIVVLYERKRGHLEGARMNFDDFASVVAGPGVHHLHEVLNEAVLEIVEPHELGPILPVPWAEGLTDHPENIHWSGDALDYFRGNRPSPPTA